MLVSRNNFEVIVHIVSSSCEGEESYLRKFGDICEFFYEEGGNLLGLLEHEQAPRSGVKQN